MQPYETAQRSERRLERTPRSESWCTLVLRTQDEEKETTKRLRKKDQK